MTVLKFSAPLTGMYLGMLFGIVFGVAAIAYLEVTPLLNRFCLIGVALLAGQLFGATVGAAAGKPRSQFRDQVPPP